MTTATAATTLSACRDVSVGYGRGEARVEALRSVNLSVGANETIALWGSSGSGKTTLLHVIGGLVEPSEGTVEWRGSPLASLDRAARSRMRATEIGYVFQSANLLEHFTANPGRVYTREQLLDAVWRDTSYVTARSVDVYIRRLREKIEKDSEDPRFLKTMRGAGYRFEAAK